MSQKSRRYLLTTIGVLLFLVSAGISAFAATIDPSDTLWVTVDNGDKAVVFQGDWTTNNYSEGYGALEMVAARSFRTYAEFTFNGTAVRWIGSKGQIRGIAEVYVDGELVGEVDCYSDELQYAQVLFTSQDLPKGSHTIRIKPLEMKNEKAWLTQVSVDAFQFIPTLQAAIESAESFMSSIVVGKPRYGDYYTPESVDACKKVVEDAKALLGVDGVAADKIASAVASVNKAKADLAASKLTVIFPDPLRHQQLPIVAVACSSNETGNTAQKAIDGDLVSRWAAQGRSEWISFDLGEVKTVSAVGIAIFVKGTRVYTFDIEGSKDGETWFHITSSDGVGTIKEFQGTEFKPVETRFIKIIGHGNNENDWNSYTEVTICGPKE